MIDIERIRTLTEKFFEGTTTLGEEQELYAFYRQEDIPQDLRPNQQLFCDLAAIQRAATLPQPAKLPQTAGRSRWISPWMAAAAAAALLLLAGTATLYQAHRPANEDECVAYIYGKRTTDRDVVMGEMQKTMTAMADDGAALVEQQLKNMFGND